MGRFNMYQKEQRILQKITSVFLLAVIILSTSSCTSIFDILKPSSEVQVGQDIEIEVIEEQEIQRENLKTDDQGEEEDIKQEDTQNLVPYSGPVQHIFFHPLIAYPKLTFDGDAQERGFNDYFVTIDEFKGVIQSLYEKDYILIDINMLIEEREEGDKKIIERSKLMLPEGKKPLIISIDDMNYYDYMRENGTIYKLVLDDEGKVATYSLTADGEELSYDNEIIPILDRFVEAHPDFSFNGAKGVIALT